MAWGLRHYLLFFYLGERNDKNYFGLMVVKWIPVCLLFWIFAAISPHYSGTDSVLQCSQLGKSLKMQGKGKWPWLISTSYATIKDRGILCGKNREHAVKSCSLPSRLATFLVIPATVPFSSSINYRHFVGVAFPSMGEKPVGKTSPT